MALFMKEILWMASLWVKLRMLIYDVFGIGKKFCLWGGTFFCFVATVCGCATSMGSGGRGVCLLSAGDPSASSGITLRLLLRVSPSETSCSFTPTGFIYSVYLYQGLASPKLLMLGN